ncbi:MAG: PAS domain S-box protein [bacterium]|nr:PAS domain S-box protein [bacterium]
MKNQKQPAQQLGSLEKKDLYQLIIETANEGVWIKDANHITTFVNKKMADMLGYSEESMVGRHFKDFTFPEDETTINQMHERRETGGTDGYELRLKNHKGEVVWVFVNASALMKEGKYLGSLGMLSNITVHKQKEQKRIEQERRYRSLFEDSPVPIWDEDFSEVKKYIDNLKAQGIKDIRSYFENNTEAVVECSALLKVNDVNQAVVDLNEAPNKEYMLANYTKLIDAKSAEYAINQFEAIANGDKSCEFDAELRTFNSNIVHVHLKWTVVKGYEDTYEKVYLSTTDLTDRIVAENANLRKSNDQKELLLKEIHHRVKNNLQIITSLLKLQANSVEDAATIELFELSLHRINSMALVHDLLYRSEDFSRINYGLYLETLVTPLIESMKHDDAEIELEIKAENVSLNINTSIPLGLLINEIITNSLKHGLKNTELGTIYIHITKEENGDFCLSMGDNGVGFPRDIDIEQADSLGLQLITSLGEQLMGEIVRRHDEPGTHYKLVFKELPQRQPIAE